MQLTGAQHDAVHVHHKNLIVTAGAGSGKTRVLVERYLALLANNPDWSLNSLVAITFTKKAAAEMRDRVRRELEQRQQDAADIDKPRWRNLLGQMDSARIDTIHGLCATLLRANAAEAGVDPDFEVLDEIDAAVLRETVVDQVLQVLVAEGDPALALFDAYDLRAVRQVLADPNLLSLDLHALPADFFQHWQELWAEEAQDQLRLFQHIAARADIPISLPAKDGLADKWRTCLAHLDQLRSSDALETRADSLKAIATLEMRGGSEKNWGSLDEFQSAKTTLTRLRDAAKDFCQFYDHPVGEDDQIAAGLMAHWISLLSRTQRSYQTAKERRRGLDFNDLEQRTRRLLAEYPDVRDRYRGKEFRHLLVDEFQDTNGDQWDIIRALANVEVPGSLFVVGDEKQSIYQFRGADVSVFGAVKTQITSVGGQPVSLAESFRTHEPLVSLFNRVFGRLLVRDETSPISAYQVALDDAMTAFRKTPPSAEPPLSILLIDKYVRDADGTPVVSDRGRGRRKREVSAEDGRRWEAFAIARYVHDLVQRQVPVFDKRTNAHRPIEYGDVALLFRSMTAVNLYEEVFKAAELPFMTFAGRGYYNRQEVWDLLNLLRALHNPADNLSLASALRSPLFNLSDDALLALRLARTQDGKPVLLWDALAAPERVPTDEQALVIFAHECLQELARLAGRVTISELLREALARTGYLATLTGLPDGARRRGNIEKLLDKAVSSGKITLGAFTQYLGDLTSRGEVRESEASVEVANVVSLMTIHASKGLEFPLVALVDAAPRSIPSHDDLLRYDVRYGLSCKLSRASDEDDERGSHEPYAYSASKLMSKLREDAESLRLLYVAMTRAQDYLLISGRGCVDDGSLDSRGWLKEVWNALDLNDTDPSEHVQVIHHRYADMPSDDLLSSAASSPKSAWDSIDKQAGEPRAPILLGTVRIERDAAARHLSTTQIADLGSAHFAQEKKEQDFYKNRLRRQVLYDAPAHIEEISKKPAPSFQRLIGEIVHEALRQWRFPTAADDLGGVLDSYAWKHGIIDTDQRREAVTQARRLLSRIADSDIYRDINGAESDGRRVFRELPFVFRTDQRIIHGIIDVLFQRPDESWVIVDYKTSRVPQEISLEAHARRYHLQVGVYASAVREQLNGITPETYIHYIRHQRTIRIARQEWQDAVERLESLIGSTVWDE